MSDKDYLSRSGVGAADAKARGRHPAFAAPISKPDKIQTLQSLGPIPSYHGPLPSPFPIINYKAARGEPTGSRFLNQREIRKWVREAAKYHEVPYEMLAVVLQNENAPNVGLRKKFLQFGERTAQTYIHDFNKRFGDPIGKLDRAIQGLTNLDVIPNGVYRGSSGLVNISAGALNSAANHSESFRKRPVIPPELRIRQDGYDSDTRIPGADWRSDLYYGAAHLRELFDRYRRPWEPGKPLDLKMAKRVFAAYNGSGKDADKYGRDSMRLLRDAASGKRHLYFYAQ